MKKVILLAILIVAVSLNLQAQGTSSKGEMMKLWEKYMTPGDVHKMMSDCDGVWTEDITMWMDPSAPPTKNTAKVTYRMVLGGRYQESKHIGTFDGKPFEGYSTLGYDNAKKTFQSTWIDNMGTGTMFMEGTWDDATKTIHFKGKCVDPMSGQDMVVREEFKIIDDNTQKLEMFMTMPGKPEMKSMEIILKREVKKPHKK